MSTPSEIPSPSTPEHRKFELSPTQIVETPHERIRRVVGEAVGAASMAWHEPGPANSIFDEAFARDILEAVLAHIEDYVDAISKDRVTTAREKNERLRPDFVSLYGQASEQIADMLVRGELMMESRIEVIPEQPRDERGRPVPTPDVVAKIKADTFAGLAAYFAQSDGTAKWEDTTLAQMMREESANQHRLALGDPRAVGDQITDEYLAKQAVEPEDQWNGLKVGDLVEYATERPAGNQFWTPLKAGQRGVVTLLITADSRRSPAVVVDGIRGSNLPGNLKKVGPIGSAVPTTKRHGVQRDGWVLDEADEPDWRIFQAIMTELDHQKDLGYTLEHDLEHHVPGDMAYRARQYWKTGDWVKYATMAFAAARLADQIEIRDSEKAPAEPAPAPAIHFAPWGAARTSCGLSILKYSGEVETTVRRDMTTCPDCRARFTNPTDEEAAMAENETEPEDPRDALVKDLIQNMQGVVLTEAQARRLVESIQVRKDYNSPDWDGTEAKARAEAELAKIRESLTKHQTGIDENPAVAEYADGTPVETGPDGIPILREVTAREAQARVMESPDGKSRRPFPEIPVEAIDARLRELGLIG